MDWTDKTLEELEYLKEVLYDDWNFGHGDQNGFGILQDVETEIKRRKSTTVVKQTGKEWPIWIQVFIFCAGFTAIGWVPLVVIGICNLAGGCA